MRVETAQVVVFEVAFSLGRRYQVPRQEIRDLVKPVLELPNLDLPDKALLLRALDIFVERKIPFGDAVVVATMEARGRRTIYSWDAEFDRIPGIVRIEPTFDPV